MAGTMAPTELVAPIASDTTGAIPPPVLGEPVRSQHRYCQGRGSCHRALRAAYEVAVVDEKLRAADTTGRPGARVSKGDGA